MPLARSTLPSDHDWLPEPAAFALVPDHILPKDKRRALIDKARDTGLGIDEILLGEQLVSEAVYYEWVAQRLGLTFSPHPLKIIPPLRARDAWQSRMVRLDPAHAPKEWLVAPKGQALEQMLTHRLTSNDGFANLVITLPSALFRAITDSKATSYTQHFSTYLHQKRPHFSCHDLYLNPRRRIIPLLALPALVMALQGLDIALSQALTLLLLPVLLLRLAILGTPLPISAQAPALSDTELPTYSLLVPLYREGALVRQLIDSFTALDYPSAKREVLFLLEEDDYDTRSAFEALSLPYNFHVIMVPKGLPRTKPRALNLGLAFASGTLLVVYDAEDRPHPQQLRQAAKLFAQEETTKHARPLACLQASLVIDNGHDNPLACLFALEYAAQFDIALPRLAQRQWPIPLGGSSNHFRRDILSQVMGWDAWNVTEDADLGLRLHRLGYRIAYLPSATYEDAPDTLRDWFMQRRRWIKGWIMTSAVHLQHPHQWMREQGIIVSGVVLCQSLGLTTAILFWPFTIIGIPITVWVHKPTLLENLLMFAPFLCSLSAILWPLLQGAKQRKHPIPFWLFPALPLYFLLMTAAGWAGLWEYVTRPHYWNKTPHKPHL